MRFEPIVPALLSRDSNGVPYSRAYGDVYHPLEGAAGQARHVFLGGNELPARWQGQGRFVILETGFGLGNNFLATWQAWRDDPHHCARLHFVSVEKHPLNRGDLGQVHANSPWPELAAALLAAWPPLTPDLHCLCFEGGKVELLLALGDAQAWLPQLVAHVDAFYLDGFAPARNPAMWEPRLFKALARLAAPRATLATWSVARSVRDGLECAGFRIDQARGFGGKREMMLGRFEPAFTPRRPPARRVNPTSVGVTAHAGGARRHAVILGAGLAGCATAWALAQQGWTSTLLDRHPGPAQEASGSQAGAFHGIVNAQDGAHARFNRAASLHARCAISHAVERGAVAGKLNGLLRLETKLPGVAAMKAILKALGLPEDYVRVLDAGQASRTSGLALAQPAWFYPGGGCVDPAALARDFLRQSSGACTFRGGAAVESIRRNAGLWQLFDASGRLIEEATNLALANAGDALRLLGRPAWPLRSMRGQVSVLPAAAWPANTGLPKLAISGDGFVLPELNGTVLFGATSAAADADTSVRESDQLANTERLTRLCNMAWSPPVELLQGRVAWRCSSIDRLPLIGAVPLAHPAAPSASSRWDQARLVPRETGLYVFIGLGSRGITWSALGARLLASWIVGSPAPLPAGLIDALDPARFVTQSAQRTRRGPGAFGPG
ncbi:MAG: bifunctional tRNA (5-methylaminomethyl-2-thiouridine)(34)-methyltransferase MnmD/FAD-dependent 5-carboxymethylaminomethyl-2-thiouridine(34) oxidoreductase MnmC [Burkholderiaceae bacterium]